MKARHVVSTVVLVLLIVSLFGLVSSKMGLTSPKDVGYDGSRVGFPIRQGVTKELPGKGTFRGSRP